MNNERGLRLLKLIADGNIYSYEQKLVKLAHQILESESEIPPAIGKDSRGNTELEGYSFKDVQDLIDTDLIEAEKPKQGSRFYFAD